MLQKIDETAKKLDSTRTDVISEALDNFFDGDADLLILARKIKRFFTEEENGRKT